MGFEFISGILLKSDFTIFFPGWGDDDSFGDEDDNPFSDEEESAEENVLDDGKFLKI